LTRLHIVILNVFLYGTNEKLSHEMRHVKLYRNEMCLRANDVSIENCVITQCYIRERYAIRLRIRYNPI